MHKLLISFCRHPWAVLISLLIVSILAASQLEKVKVQISAEDLLVQNDPERDYYDRIIEEFGEEKVILLYLSDQKLLDKTKLEALQKAIERIETFEFVAKTESLFTVPYLKTVDGYLNKDPYLVSLPENEEQSSDLLSAALKNPFIHKTLLSEDGSVMAVAIILKSDLSGFTDVEITDSLKTVTGELEKSYSKAFTVGFQHVRTEVASQIRSEQGRLLPLAIAALLIALFLMLRQLVDILIPVMTAGISILWTLGVMGFLEIPLNVVTSMVPILLIIVGSTEDIHLLAEFRRGQHDGMEKIRAIRKMAEKMGSIVSLTFVTTFLGFLSITLSQIEVLWQFGVLSAMALLLNFIITISLIPAVLRITGDWKLDGKSNLLHSPDVEPEKARSFFIALRRYRWHIGAVVIACSIYAFYGMLNIKVNHNPIDSLSSESEVRSHFDNVNEQLSGLESMSLVIDSGIQDTFLKVRYLEQAREIQDFINQQPGIQSTTSFMNYLSLLNAAFDEIEEPSMPDTDEIVNELMIFLKYEHVESYVSEDFSKIRLLVRHNISSTFELNQVVNNIQQYIDENLDPGLTARLTGNSVLTISATNAMIQGQLQSIILLLLIILIIISMLFLDWKVGLIAVLPNIFPVVILFGFMGIAEIPLNIGTTMAAAIAIGIAVDDTMHFMLRYNNELKTKRSKYAAMYETIHSEALPVLATSLALISGFMVFAFSDFEPVAQFGYLSALVIFAALIADFVITPLAISTLRLVSLWDMISLTVRKEVIEKSGLFDGMKSWHIRKFILASAVHYFHKGQHIFDIGDDSDTMYMVMRGRVRVIHDSKLKIEGIEEYIGPGEVFGDISMFANTKRLSQAVATEKTSLLVLSRDAIMNTTYFHPIISARLFYNIASHVSHRFSTLVHTDELGKKQKNKDKGEIHEI